VNGIAGTAADIVVGHYLYSLVETAKANDLDRWRYLETLFERLPAAANQEDFDALLPWRIKLRDIGGDGARVASS